jgi:DNA-binding transcriptional LysR family regulator
MMHFVARPLSLKIVPVELPVQPWPVGIVTLKNRTLSPVAQLFLDCARKASKPLRTL